MRALTDLQRRVLEHLVREHRQTGLWPTYREVADHFGWKSVHTPYLHVKALISKGALERDAARPRCLRLTRAGRSLTIGLGRAA